MDLELKKFKDINLEDSFFDSLKSSYEEFSDWFERKSEESAYVFARQSGAIDGFLYLKVEEGVVDDVGVLQGSCRVSRVFKLLFSLPAAPSLG